MGTVIGGHPGMHVCRLGNGQVLKYSFPSDDARYTEERNGLALNNEARILRALADTDFVPRVYEVGDGWHVQQDLGDKEDITDPEVFRRHCVRILIELRRHNIRHGDLTDSNMIVRNNKPYVIDWQESHFLDEPAPQKSPYTDSYFIYRGTADYLPDSYRVARRWRAILSDMVSATDLTLPLRGKTLVDLGCFEGDFCGMAAAEGMTATGIDTGGFHSGHNSINEARKLWPECTFIQGNVLDWDTPVDVALCMNTWPYVANHYGREQAEDFLARIIKNSGRLYFKCQLHTDGPGPEFLKDDGDVKAMIERLGGKAYLIDSFDAGRPKKRTLWRIE